MALNVPSFAQDSGGESGAADHGLEGVVVTARNRSKQLQEVPIPISVVSGATLDRDRTFTVAELSQRAPGLTATTPNARRSGISDLGAGITHETNSAKYELSIVAKNAFDTKYTTSVNDFSNSAPVGYDGIGPRRYVGVILRASF